jgi:alpha-galactosidase
MAAEDIVHSSRNALIAAIALILVRTPAGVAEPMHFFARPANGLAMTPPMGWNSWNHFACNVSASLIERQADAMVASGMKAAGYRYVIIDDCWQVGRDANGNIQADSQRFPQGIGAVADYVHAKGLKFGIYSDVGDHTCQMRPGSRGHEYQDALQYARWGVDYLKYDWCNTGGLDARSAYATMSDALRATGRPIVFSICNWGRHQPWLWGAQAGGNLWRTTQDIWDHWSGPRGYSLGVLDILDQQAGLAAYAGPGHWNDPDMLEIGNGGMTDAQYRAQLSLWAILAAPLIAGNDLTQMSPATRAILTNREVIAVDQDSLGMEGHRVWKDGDAEIWVRPLTEGREAVVLLNRGDRPRSIRLAWSALGLPSYLPLRLRDLWRHEDLPLVTGSLTLQVPPTAVRMLRETPARPQS